MDQLADAGTNQVFQANLKQEQNHEHQIFIFSPQYVGDELHNVLLPNVHNFIDALMGNLSPVSKAHIDKVSFRAERHIVR